MNELEILQENEWVNLSESQKDGFLEQINDESNQTKINELHEFLIEKANIANSRQNDSRELEDLKELAEKLKLESEMEVVSQFETLSKLRKKNHKNNGIEKMNEHQEGNRLKNIKSRLNLSFTKMVKIAENLDFDDLSEVSPVPDFIPSFER